MCLYIFHKLLFCETTIKRNLCHCSYDLCDIVCTLFNFPSNCVQSQKFRLISSKFSCIPFIWSDNKNDATAWKFVATPTKIHAIANQTNTFLFDRWWFLGDYTVSREIPFIYRINGNSHFNVRKCGDVIDCRGESENESVFKFLLLKNYFEWITSWLPTLLWHHFLALFNRSLFL